MMLDMSGMGAGEREGFVKGEGGYSYRPMNNGVIQVMGPSGQMTFANPGTTAHAAIERELFGGREADRDARLEEHLQGEMEELGMDRDPIRLEERVQPEGQSFEPSGAVDELYEEALRPAPGTIDDDIAAREKALQAELGEISELRMSEGQGGFADRTVDNMEATARRQAGIRPMRQVRRKMSRD